MASEILSQEAAAGLAQCRMLNKFRLDMENDIAVMGFCILAGKGDGWITHDFISSNNVCVILVSAALLSESASYSWPFVPAKF